QLYAADLDLHHAGRRGGQREADLAAADQLQIDVGENLAVEQRPVQGPLGIVDPVVLAERIEADPGARMDLPGEHHGIDYLVAEHGVGKARMLGVEEADIESRVMDDQGAIADKVDEVGN